MRLVVALTLIALALAPAGSAGPADSAGTASTARWSALKPALLERTEVGAARIGRFVSVVGGFRSSDGRTTSAVERYDIERNSWRRVRAMPVALNHTVAVAYRGDLYVMGGYASTTGLAQEVDTRCVPGGAPGSPSPCPSTPYCCSFPAFPEAGFAGYAAGPGASISWRTSRTTTGSVVRSKLRPARTSASVER